MNMGRGLSSGNPTVTAAFPNALNRQLQVTLFRGMVLAIVWNSVRIVRYCRAALAGRVEVFATPGPYPEPAASCASPSGSCGSSTACSRPGVRFRSVSPHGHHPLPAGGPPGSTVPDGWTGQGRMGARGLGVR
jgi:hypothetical protein